MPSTSTFPFTFIPKFRVAPNLQIISKLLVPLSSPKSKPLLPDLGLSLQRVVSKVESTSFLPPVVIASRSLVAEVVGVLARKVAVDLICPIVNFAIIKK
jgi:hypothetical protein